VTDGLSDPRLDDVMVTVTRVRVAEDLSSATLHVSILPKKAESKAVHALQDAARYIRREAAERVSLHKMPDLLFRVDRSMQKQAELLSAFGEVEREREANNTPPDPDEPPPSPDGDTP
jgi:ribosome-binding factor A